MLLLIRRVLTLQHMHRYFVVNEYLAVTQSGKRRFLLYFSRMVQQRSFRQRNGRRAWAWPRPQNWFRVLLANRDMDPLWKMHFRVTRPTFLARTWVVWNIRCFTLYLLKLLSCKKMTCWIHWLVQLPIGIYWKRCWIIRLLPFISTFLSFL